MKWHALIHTASVMRESDGRCFRLTESCLLSKYTESHTYISIHKQYNTRTHTYTETDLAGSWLPVSSLWLYPHSMCQLVCVCEWLCVCMCMTAYVCAYVSMCVCVHVCASESVCVWWFSGIILRPYVWNAGPASSIFWPLCRAEPVIRAKQPLRCHCWGRAAGPARRQETPHTKRPPDSWTDPAD